MFTCLNTTGTHNVHVFKYHRNTQCTHVYIPQEHTMYTCLNTTGTHNVHMLNTTGTHTVYMLNITSKHYVQVPMLNKHVYMLDICTRVERSLPVQRRPPRCPAARATFSTSAGTLAASRRGGSATERTTAGIGRTRPSAQVHAHFTSVFILFIHAVISTHYTFFIIIFIYYTIFYFI